MDKDLSDDSIHDSGYSSDWESPSTEWDQKHTKTEPHGRPWTDELWDGIPRVQKAIVTPEVGECLNLQLTEIPSRIPEAGEAIVRILYSGICRSDACFSTGPEPGFPKANHIAGHEGIGYVVAAYDSLLNGRLVAIRHLGSSCGHCTYCVRDLRTSCPHQLNAPKHIAGTFQEYVTVPTSCLVSLHSHGLFPGNSYLTAHIPAAACAALCSGSTALMALREAGTQSGHVIVVVGIAGAIGHPTGAIAKQVLEAKVIGMDLAEKIENLPDDMKGFADEFIAAPGPGEKNWRLFENQLLEGCERLRQGAGLRRVAEAVIVSASLREAFVKLDRYVCDGGHVVCVGIPRGQHAASLNINALVERNLHLSGTLMGNHDAALTVMEWILSGQICPRITEVSPEEVADQMQSLVDCKVFGKLVVRFGA